MRSGWLASGIAVAAVIVAGASLLGGYLYVRLNELRDASELAADIGGLRTLPEDLGRAALVPESAGGGAAALEESAEQARHALTGIEDDLAALLGAEATARDLRLLVTAIDDLEKKMEGVLSGEAAFTDPDFAASFYGYTNQVDEIVTEIVAESASRAEAIRDRVLIGLGVFALAAAGTTAGVATLLRRARVLRENERAAAQRYEAAEQERRQFESFAESVDAGLVITDVDGKIGYANTRIAQLLGRASDERAFESLAELRQRVLVRAIDRDASGTAWCQLTAGSKEFRTAEFEIAGSPSSVIHCTAFPMRAADGAAVGRGFFFTDITASKHVDRMKNEFIGLASHELRTPLTGILGFSELQLTQPDSPQARTWTSQINREARRLTRIVDSMLNVSRLEAGTLEISNEEIELGELLADVADAVRGERSPAHRLHFQPDAMEARLRGDRGKLTQVLINLVSNALKYSPDGGPVEVSSAQNDAETTIAVSDQGLGIPADQLTGLFQRFHRVSSAGREAIRGTGLGLYLVRQLVEAMGGRVTVASEPGVGSTFTVVLPTAGVPQGSRSTGDPERANTAA